MCYLPSAGHILLLVVKLCSGELFMIVLYDCHNRVVVVVVVVLMQMLVKDGLLCECCDSDYVCNSVMLCRLMLYCSCCSCCCVTDSVSGGDYTFH